LRNLAVRTLSGGLSPQLVADTARTMSGLRERGMTLLVVEQNLGLALKAADRYLILRDGLRRYRARDLSVKG
jgi:ABC-type branched-subunit amino acid transport system ATPase component